MLHFHTSSFTILVQRHLLIYYIYSSPIDTKLVENASLPLIPSQSSPPDLSICPFLYIRLSAQPPPLHAYFFLVRVFSSRGKSSITEINSSLAVLIVDALHQTTMRDAFPESIYTHTHTYQRAQTRKRSIDIHIQPFKFYFIFPPLFFFFLFPSLSFGVRSSNNIAFFPWNLESNRCNARSVCTIAIRSIPSKLRMRVTCNRA